MPVLEEVECSACNGTGHKGGLPLDSPEAEPCLKCKGRGFMPKPAGRVTPPSPPVDAPDVSGAYAPLEVTSTPTGAASTTPPRLIVLYSAGVQFVHSPAVPAGQLTVINPETGKLDTLK